jgi:hypothetical protein
MADNTKSQDSGAAGAKPRAVKANGMTKKEAVRKALKKLGRNAKPAQLQPYIKEMFGFDMTPAHITTAKGELLRGKGGKGKAAGKKRHPAAQAPALPAAPQQGAPKAPPAGNGAAAGRVSLKDIAVVKDLLGRVGADNLRTLIDLLAR